jgi:hypothetical protein
MEIDESQTEPRSAPESQVTASRWSNLPFAITLAALLIYFSFQTLQLLVQRGELSGVKNSQDAALQTAQKVEERFKSTMSKLDELSNQGHAGAKMVLDGLQNTGGPEQRSGK